MGMPMELHATQAAAVVYSNIVDLPQDQYQEGATSFISLLGSPHLYYLLESQSS